MNVLIISPWSDDWDINRVVGGPKIALLVKGLAEKGIHVHLLIPRKKGFTRSTVNNLTLHIIPNLWLPRIKFAAPLVQLIYYVRISLAFLSHSSKLAKLHSFDLIWGLSSFSALAAYQLGRRLDKPAILKLFGIMAFYPVMKWNPLYWLRHFSNVIAYALPFDRLIVVDDGTHGDKAAAYFGVPDERFLFHTHVVNKRLASLPRSDALARNLGFSPHDRILLFTSRLTRSKRLDIAIRAMALVIENEPGAKLLVVGDGPTRRKNEELAKRLGIHERIRFVGSVRHADTWPYYHIAHVFLSTNTLSNLCLPAVEAMACGVPVVALDIRGTGKLVQNEVTGLLVQPKDDTQACEEMANAACRLLRDHDLHKRIADDGRAFVLSNFPDWNDRIEEQVRLIESLVHPNPARRNHKIITRDR